MESNIKFIKSESYATLFERKNEDTTTIVDKRNDKTLITSPIIIYSGFNGNEIDPNSTSNNFINCDSKKIIDDNSIQSEKYLYFSENMKIMMNATLAESGVYYDYEEYFASEFLKNRSVSIMMLTRLLRENYSNERTVKSFLHIISHYEYADIGEDTWPCVSSLFSHKSKGIRKFALKVFDNWNAKETLEILKGSQLMKEEWLNKYRLAIIERLEGFE